MPEKKLKPVAGRFAPMQDGRDWPLGGTKVEMTHYYRRRLKAGDLVEVGASRRAAVPPQTGELPAKPAEEPDRKGRKTGDE